MNNNNKQKDSTSKTDKFKLKPTNENLLRINKYKQFFKMNKSSSLFDFTKIKENPTTNINSPKANPRDSKQINSTSRKQNQIPFFTPKLNNLNTKINKNCSEILPSPNKITSQNIENSNTNLNQRQIRKKNLIKLEKGKENNFMCPSSGTTTTRYSIIANSLSKHSETKNSFENLRESFDKTSQRMKFRVFSPNISKEFKESVKEIKNNKEKKLNVIPKPKNLKEIENPEELHFFYVALFKENKLLAKKFDKEE